MAIPFYIKFLCICLLNLDKEITILNTNVGSLSNKVIELSQTQSIDKQLNNE